MVVLSPSITRTHHRGEELVTSDSEPTRKSEIPASSSGMRLDRALAELFPDYSRSTLQKWLKQGLIVVDDAIPAQRDRVQGGELVELTPPAERPVHWQPQAMDLDIVFQDEHVLVLNKPAGLVVHPGAGNPDGTLVNGLLHAFPDLAGLPRGGIVHRLDKDTTGLMVVARSESARLALVEQLAARCVRRTYAAVVQGMPVAGGCIDEPIGRDRQDRRRMAVSPGGKPAVTHYRVVQRFRAHALLKCRIETGRTHQIRVHLKHVGLPILGDPVYGGRGRLPPAANETLRTLLQNFRRQALHAEGLSFVHPHTGRQMTWSAQMPRDMHALCLALADNAR